MPVITSGYGTLGSVLFGQPNQGTVNYFEQVKERVAAKSSSYAAEFIQTSNQIFDSVYSARALELTRAAINKAGALFDPDVIKYLHTLTELQLAKPTMARFIMANEVVRQRFIDGRCEGYGDAYPDHQPGAIGENHYDYRRMMNGMVQVDEETGEGGYKIYCEDLREGDENITPNQQLDSYNTGKRAEFFMLMAAKDPTSSWNCDL